MHYYLKRNCGLIYEVIIPDEVYLILQTNFKLEDTRLKMSEYCVQITLFRHGGKIKLNGGNTSI